MAFNLSKLRQLEDEEDTKTVSGTTTTTAATTTASTTTVKFKKIQPKNMDNNMRMKRKAPTTSPESVSNQQELTEVPVLSTKQAKSAIVTESSDEEEQQEQTPVENAEESIQKPSSQSQPTEKLSVFARLKNAARAKTVTRMSQKVCEAVCL